MQKQVTCCISKMVCVWGLNFIPYTHAHVHATELDIPYPINNKQRCLKTFFYTLSLKKIVSEEPSKLSSFLDIS